MTILAQPRDDNGSLIHGCGSQLITKRYAGVTTAGTAISLPADCKEFLVHVEGANVAFKVLGTATGSAVAYITADGFSLENIPVAKTANATLLTVYAPSGTINVSVIGRR
jgi:hypothetical protein